MRSFCSLFLLAVLSCLPALAKKGGIAYVNQPLVPSSIAPGGPSFTLTVNGSGFMAGAVLTWDGKPRKTNVINGSQLTASILASDIATAHTAIVAVHNPSAEASNTVSFPVADSVSTFKMRGVESETAGQNHYGLVTADFNNDGNVDVAVIAGTGISVFLGNGDGTFLPRADYPFPQEDALALACADFNNDGKLDLVATSDNLLLLFLGNGDGTFAAPTPYVIGGGPWHMITGDFNGDGHMDVAVTTTAKQSYAGQVSVLLGNGDGTFGPRKVTTIGLGDTPLAIAEGDFNGDGKLDLVTAAFGNTYSILLGNGDGTFSVQTTVVTSCVSGVTTADFNGNGILDLAVTIGCGDSLGQVSILLGNGDGTFGQPQYFKTNGLFPSNVVTGDFNNDGKTDLLVADFSAAPGIFLGNGDGTFQTVMKFPTNVGNGFNLVSAEDMNNDGQLDIVLGNTSYEMAEIDVLLQKR